MRSFLRPRPSAAARRRSRAALSLLTLFAAACLGSGCASVDLLLRVRPDGSGTARLEARVDVFQTQNLIAAFSTAGGAESGFSTAPVYFGRSSLEALPASLGEGVELVSGEVLEGEEIQGVKAELAFADVAALAPDLLALVPALAGSFEGQEVASLSFAFERGEDSSTLTVRLPGAAAAGEGTVAEAPDPAGLAMTAALFEGLRARLEVEALGRLVRASTPHVDESRVTVFALDLDRMVANGEAFSRAVAALPGSFAEFHEISKTLDGLDVGPKPELEIEIAEFAAAGGAP